MKKLLLLATLICSFSSLAQYHLSDYPLDPNTCGTEESCHNGYVPLWSSGTYHARGFGRTCAEAMERSEDNFIRTFGQMSCGEHSGPYSWTCDRSRDGRSFVSWSHCSPDSASAGPTKQPINCGWIFGRLICGSYFQK